MLGLLHAIPLLFAEAAPVKGADGGSPWGLSTYILFIPILFYFIVLRPQQQQDRKRKDLITTLKKNDRVLTAAGIYGTVVSVNAEADRVVVRIDDERGVKVEFTKASIARVVEPTEKTAEVAEKPQSR